MANGKKSGSNKIRPLPPARQVDLNGCVACEVDPESSHTFLRSTKKVTDIDEKSQLTCLPLSRGASVSSFCSSAPLVPGECSLVSPKAVEKWQRADSFGIICVPCNKYCDGGHERTADHAKRLWAYRVTLEGDYIEPDDPWLAWMPCVEWGDGEYLKCIMCNKWVQDLEGTDPRGYAGQHGRDSCENTKEHQKKLKKRSWPAQEALRGLPPLPKKWLAPNSVAERPPLW